MSQRGSSHRDREGRVTPGAGRGGTGSQPRELEPQGLEEAGRASQGLGVGPRPHLTWGSGHSVCGGLLWPPQEPPAGGLQGIKTCREGDLIEDHLSFQFSDLGFKLGPTRLRCVPGLGCGASGQGRFRVQDLQGRGVCSRNRGQHVGCSLTLAACDCGPEAPVNPAVNPEGRLTRGNRQ